MVSDAVKRSMGKKRDRKQFFVDREEAVCLYGQALEAYSPAEFDTSVATP